MPFFVIFCAKRLLNKHKKAYTKFGKLKIIIKLFFCSKQKGEKTKLFGFTFIFLYFTFFCIVLLNNPQTLYPKNEGITQLKKG